MTAATTSIQIRTREIAARPEPSRMPALPWRDPHSVPKEQLAAFISSLIEACTQNPDNADLRTCLGIAHAMNYDVHRSTDAFEEALRLQPDNFLAQLKYAELFFRLRVIDRAEAETSRSLELAGNYWELSLARRQLSEIRRLRHKGLSRPQWTKSLKTPAIVLMLLLLGVACIFLVWK